MVLAAILLLIRNHITCIVVMRVCQFNALDLQIVDPI